MSTRHARWMVRAIACAALSLSFALHAREPEQIADGVQLLRGDFVPGRQPDGNTVMVRGSDGWIVVDTGRHAEHTQAILDAAMHSNLPITDIINTHWHLDHVSGNAALRSAHPQSAVHASEAIVAAMGGFLANYRKQLVEISAAQANAPQHGDWQLEIARIDQGERLFPTQPVTATQRRRLAGRELELHLSADAATDGDVWIVDRATRTLIAGDLVTLPVPFLDTACPAGWTRALDEFGRIPFKRLVPGHGPVLDRKQFRRYRTAFARLRDCAAGAATPAQCADGWIEDLGDLLPASEHAAVKPTLDYYVSQRLRGAGATADCAAAR